MIKKKELCVIKRYRLFKYVPFNSIFYTFFFTLSYCLQNKIFMDITEHHAGDV